MTDTRTSGADLWTAASADVERETEERLFTAARIEASEFWPVIASATTKADFTNRLSLVAPQLDRVTASVLDDETDGFYASVRTSLDQAFEHDFDLLQERRTAQVRRHQASLQREVLADLVAQADDTWSGPSPEEFLDAPADGQSGSTTPSDGTPGAAAPDNASGDQPTLDDSEGPNILPDEDVVNSVTGAFITAEFHEAAVEFQRRHFQHIADAVKSAPVDEETRRKLADHFASHMAGTNDRFDRGKFIKACTGSRLDFSEAAAKTAAVTTHHPYKAAKEVICSGPQCPDHKEGDDGQPHCYWCNKHYDNPIHNARDVEKNRRVWASKVGVKTPYGTWDESIDARTTCPQCHNRGFDGKSCHACGFNAKVGGIVDKVKDKVKHAEEDVEADAIGHVLDHTKLSEKVEDPSKPWNVEMEESDVQDWRKRNPDYLKAQEDDVKRYHGSIDGESWDTGEVALWFANDYGLYQAAKNAGSPRELAQIWAANGPVGSVDTDNVSWNAVYNDVKAED